MVAPTEAFRDLPALTPEKAADLVLRALITRETELGTRIGRSLALLHAALPSVARRILELAHRAAFEDEPEAA